MAIMVPSEAPIGMDSKMPFTISPMRNDMMKKEK
jgi:hypothetical protein